MTGNFYGNTLVVSPQLVWVRVRRYCELSGETKAAVDGKCKDGVWIEGLHWIIAPDHKKRINLQEVDLWVQHKESIPARLKSRRGCKPAIPKRPIA